MIYRPTDNIVSYIYVLKTFFVNNLKSDKTCHFLDFCDNTFFLIFQTC